MAEKAYIVEAVRTAGGKRDGRLSLWHPADLGAKVLDELVTRLDMDPALVDDVVFGCVDQVGAQSGNVARNAVLSSSFPESVPGTSVDRQCGSSQQAIHFAIQAVMSGTQDVVIGGGVEVMSMVPIGAAVKDMGWDLETQVVKITNMWAIINKDRAFNERHHHGNSSLSAAYYVKAEKNSGDIIFFDPRQANVFHHPASKEANSLNCQVQSVTPKAGTLVLFPSYLEHKVDENLSNEERIVISFNIKIQMKPK